MFGNNGLSLLQSPPLKASLPFFLMGPLFLIIATIALFLNDINLLERWATNTIGLAHFFNLGFLVMIMMGVLTQMLPVLAGVTFPKVVWFSRFIHLLIAIGAFCFPLGMILMKPLLIQIGAISAWSAIFIFYTMVLFVLQKGIPSLTVTSFRLSSLSALTTLLFAGRLVWGWAQFGEFSLYKIPMIELHIAWALFGMTFILIMGVASKVVPMFYVTPDNFHWSTHYGPKIIFSLLVLWTVIFQTYLFEKFIWLQHFIPFIKSGISFIVISFAIQTWQRLKKRKRPITDTSILYWQLSMILFALGAFLYASSQFIDNFDKIEIFASALFGMAILSLITGMLYKIVPFLIWFHLNAKGIKNVPTMREILPDRFSRKQLGLHMGMIVFLIMSLFVPHLTMFFRFFLLVSLSSTLFLLLLSLKRYRNCLKMI